VFEFLKPKPGKYQDPDPARECDVACPAADVPSDLDALLLAAADAALHGDLEAAIAAYSRVIDLDPGHAVAHYKRGNMYKDRTELEKAIANYDQAILLEPTFAHAFCNRGVVLDRLERLGDALLSYDQALSIDPADAVSHHNRAMVLQKLDRPEEALASFDRAIAINPGYAEAYCNRGTLLQDLKQWDLALASYDRSIEIHPGLALAYFNRGTLLQARKSSVQSLADYNKAIELDPRGADAYCNRGLLLRELKRPAEGLASIDRAIELAPDSVSAHFSRAEALMAAKQFEAAITSYDRAFALKRTHPFLMGSRRFAKMILCDWHDIAAEIQELSASLEGNLLVTPPFHFAAFVDDAGLQQRAAQIWTNKVCPPDPSLPSSAWPGKRAKIHLGYFSADFREHPVSLLMAELFERHDRSKFEVTGFYFGPETQDPLRMRLERSFDQFLDVRDLSDTEVSSLARKLQVDVAIDLGGHTAEARTHIFALRAAPVQVNYLGYPGTMGAPYIDYLIADPTVIPPSLSRHYTEKIVHLPDCFLPNDSTREIAASPHAREQCGIPTGAFIFCCFNNSYKITPPVFDAWMRILGRAPDTILWLSQHHPTATNNLRREASQRGIDPARLVFAHREPSQPEYLARLRLGDLFLDTLPYNAHTTAIDALWAGLPVLTRVGEGFAGRVAASLLNAIGLPELITSTVENYQDLAVDLARNPARLTALRRRLADNRLAAPLFDTVLFTQHLESAYRQMHARRLAALPPAAFCVDPIRSQHGA
jgi:predicted O-linked N-acetylglucosamine transferase (SPINDLY family)